MHCGKRLRNLIHKAGFQYKDFAAKIDTAPQTLSTWFKWDDIPLGNIRRCCVVLNIKLWEFFVEDDAELKDYVPSYITQGWIDLIKAFESKCTEDQKEKILTAFLLIIKSY
jgi:transcriptional regulator with XRE-family HTH domain